MPRQEYKIKNKKNAMSCYYKYWNCEDHSCPLFDHCLTGRIFFINDYEIGLLFEVDV